MFVTNKKGFVLIETIIVMSVLLIGMIILYSNYNKMIINSSKVNYYDNVDDMYTAYYTYKYANDLIAWNSDSNYEVIKTGNLGENFKNIFSNLNIETIYYFSKKGFENIFSEKDGNCEDKPNQLLCYDGTTINYLRSIENKNDTSKCDDTNVPCITIVKINRDDHYYFAKYEAYENNKIETDNDVPTKLESYVFDYTGKNQIFNVPYTGEYKLEVWGAQGGNCVKNNKTYDGGYGSYSVGTVQLHKGDYLFIVVGGQGGSCTKNEESVGGYNGGGKGFSNSNNLYVSGGGGATHIALRNGLLSNLTVNDIVIVAGGGGGSAFQDSKNYGKGGSGGGYKGVSAINFTTNKNLPTEKSLSTGGTQESGGKSNEDVKGSAGLFGLGASYINDKQIKIFCSGGGGGYYGGGAAEKTGGGSGGSGYIGNTNLTDKYMYCFGCEEESTDDENTYTINTIGSSNLTDKENCPDGYFDFVGNDIKPDDAIEKCAKAGDGYARITYINSEK